MLAQAENSPDLVLLQATDEVQIARRPSDERA